MSAQSDETVAGVESVDDARRLFADAAKSHPEPKPRMIVCDTKMGKGVPFLEAREKNHFIRVDPPEWQQAIAHVDSTQTEGAA